MLTFVTDKADANLELVKYLFWEYESFVDIDLTFQHFESEIENLPGPYAPPDGRLLIAVDEQGEPAGCVGLKRFSDTACEMKRLFVRPDFRRSGLGRVLAEKIIDTAQELGYQSIYVDSISSLTDAIKLYLTLGFREIPAYYNNPTPDAVHFQRPL